MKKALFLIILLGGLLQIPAQAQVQEAMQLALNIQKLAQLKKILQNMYDGYKILSDGYNKVKNIAEGNFSVHEIFLDGLMKVNPAVKQYRRVEDIVDYQIKIVQEYKAAYAQFKASGQFSTEEIDYLGRVYSNVFNKSLDNLDALLVVITAGKLRMSDDERIRAIDTVYQDISDQLSFVRYFNNETHVLAINRRNTQQEVDALRGIYAIPH